MNGLNFRSLQDKHENLLQKQLKKHSSKEKQDFAVEVKEYIEQTKRAGSYITANRERDQLRANLRYWGNYVYSIEKEFPDTELAPSTVEHKPHVAGFALGVLALLIIILISWMAIAGVNSLVQPEPTSTQVPATSSTNTVQPAVTQTSVTLTESSTPESIGINVTLSSPANGDYITPNIEFSGTFENLEPGWAIFVLFIKGDKYFPAKEYFQIPDQPQSKNWIIRTQLTESSEEMSKEQSYTIVLALALDESSRKSLEDSSETGIDISSFPSDIPIYKKTTTGLYRKGYLVIRDTTMLVYSYFDGASYDLYTSGLDGNLDGKDVIRITSTSDYNELSPDLSPDGTKIVYVKANRDGSNYAIAISDSNGDHEEIITNWTKNKLESPRWSPDSSYISYAMGDTSQSTNRASWNIHIYECSTKIDRALLEEPESFVQPYHTWLPDKNSIIFEVRSQDYGTTGFDLISISSSNSFGKQSHFFNTGEDDIQPNIKSLEDGYLFTYTTVDTKVDTEKYHNIFAVILDSHEPFPPAGPSKLAEPRRLTKMRGGDKDNVSGITIAGADHPISDPDPNTNSIYYIRNKNIYKLEFRIEEGKIILIPDAKDDYFDDEVYGDLTIKVTGQSQSISGFDVGKMNTFFPIP